MSRINMTPGPTTGGFIDPRVLHVQHFTDHDGGSCKRLYLSQPNDLPPSDYRATPKFLFQVYTTVPLDLGSDEPPHSTPNLKSLTRFIVDPATVGSESQRSPPMVEIYETVFPDALACVDHQRLEIQHRKSRRHENSVPLIPKFTRRIGDRRGRGFIFVVCSEGFKAGVRDNDLYENGAGSSGPRWVWFDRRLPASSQVDDHNRYDNDEETISAYKRDGDPMPVPPEKMEIECHVQQEPPDDLWPELALEYSKSYVALNRNPEAALGLNEDEGGLEIAGLDLTKESGDEAALAVTEIRGGIEVSTGGLGVRDPTLQYVVYVQFCQPDDLASLRPIAVRFATSLSSRLSARSTFSLRFYASQTLSTALCSYRALQEEEPSFDIGALTSTTTIAHRGPEIPKRIFPINKEPALSFNDPTTGSIEPYRTFIVVLDRADFTRGPGVLFMLAGGGQRRPRPDREYQIIDSYAELQVWRSAGMDEVAKRLAMDYPEFI